MYVAEMRASTNMVADNRVLVDIAVAIYFSRLRVWVKIERTLKSLRDIAEL